jgi:hypothetical protein
MNLAEAIGNLEGFDGDQINYVTATFADADAVVDFAPDGRQEPPSAAAMRYFLKNWIAREVLELWSEWRNGRQPTLDEAPRSDLPVCGRGVSLAKQGHQPNQITLLHVRIGEFELGALGK